jgi:SAM-dependent methyltransferase
MVVSPAKESPAVVAHYASDDIVERILRALAAAGHDIDHPTVEMFNLADQLHGGGLNATKTQAELAGIAGHIRLLDAGCGIGGGGRYLAHTYGCRVDAIDLTPQFAAAAARLNVLCGLSDKIAVREGSVTNLSYDDETFDQVWCQNVTMNVADKPRMFAEVHRVLKPGGRFSFSHLAQGPAGEPFYPLPWASDASYSFLCTPEQILRSLRDAGFAKIETHSQVSGPGTRPTNDIGAAAAMGADMPQRQANAARSAKDGRLVPMLVVTERGS